jgi:surfeit locus 1 family protein
MLVLVAAMTWLCLWQLGKAQRDDHAAPERSAVALETLSRPGQLAPEAFNRSVAAQGLYLPDQTVTIPRRILDGRSGSWVVTPLRLPDGSVAPVVRGWTPLIGETFSRDSGEITRESFPNKGQVRVEGRWMAPEQAPARASVGSGEVSAVDLAQLAPRWGNPPLHEGYLLAASETPAPPEPAGQALTRIPPTNAETSDTGAPFSNAAYALQWLAFSGFVVFLWWRILRDGWRRREPIS